MGYNTKFSGVFMINKRIDERTFEIIEEIRDSRHDDRVMPSIWCQWRVGNDDRSIEWDGGEKFYGYIGWIKYLNDKVLRPRKYRLSGTVCFQGESPEDGGQLIADGNEVRVRWNYTDDVLANFKFPSHASIDWIDEAGCVYCDVMNTMYMVSEEEDSEYNKLLGITIGNPKARVYLVDTELPPGSNRGFWRSDDADQSTPRRVSVDVFANIVDYQRGAKEIVEMMAAAAGKLKGDDWRGEFEKLRRAQFGKRRTRRK